MKLLDTLNQNNIVHISSRNWKDAIQELTRVLLQHHEIPEIDTEILQNVIDQNEYHCSFSNRGLAYPQVYSDDFETPAVILGISKDGLDYESPDGLPCNIILLIFGPKKETPKITRFLSLFRTMIKKSDIRLGMIESKDSREVIEIIRNWENEQQEIEE